MRSGRTPPYIRPDQRAFSMSNWRIVSGRELQDGELVPEWDQSLCLTVARVIQVDVATMMMSGRLKAGTRLAVLPTWWSDGTGLRGSGEPIHFTVDAKVQQRKFDLALSIPGRHLAKHLQVRSALVLVEQALEMAGDPLAAHRPGSVLWEDAITVVLEGEASRFPITVVDFVESNLGPANACWRFEWTPMDPTLPAMATMRLYVNSKHPTFHAAATCRDVTQAQVAIRSSLKMGVGEEMLRIALDKAEELETGAQDFQLGSAGRVLIDLVERVFPGRGPIGCREDRNHDPGRFQAELQARLALFGESALEGVTS